MKYYTLLERDESGSWYIAHGAFNRKDVQQERALLKQSGTIAKNLAILSHAYGNAEQVNALIKHQSLN